MGPVFDEITSFDALYASMHKCANGVRWKDSTARYLADGLKETVRLRRELDAGTYRLRPYHSFIVTDPKRREVMATAIRDRQLQRALCDGYLYHQITKGFIRDNFACQKGRGMDDAMGRMDCHLHRFYRKHGTVGWVLKCDIRHYFAETPHDVAKAAVAKRVPDEDVRRAVFAIIDSFGGDKGIGLGSQVSQLVELAVLDDLDHYIMERLQIRHYLRYMDDFIIIHEDPEFLSACLDAIEEKLAALGLAINEKTQIFPLRQGIRWLQWRFVLTPTGKVLRFISRRSIARERRKLRHMLRRGIPIAKAEESLRSWIACARRGNTCHVIRRMTEYFRQIYTEGRGRTALRYG